jgi:hypothetical protein
VRISSSARTSGFDIQGGAGVSPVRGTAVPAVCKLFRTNEHEIAARAIYAWAEVLYGQEEYLEAHALAEWIEGLHQNFSGWIMAVKR